MKKKKKHKLAVHTLLYLQTLHNAKTIWNSPIVRAKIIARSRNLLYISPGTYPVIVSGKGSGHNPRRWAGITTLSLRPFVILLFLFYYVTPSLRHPTLPPATYRRRVRHAATGQSRRRCSRGGAGRTLYPVYRYSSS